MRLVVAGAVSALVVGLGVGSLAVSDVAAGHPARVIVASTDVAATDPSDPSDTTTPVDITTPDTPAESTAPATIGSSVAGSIVAGSIVDDDSSSVTTLGIVIGVIGIVALLGLAAWWMVRRDDIDDAPHPPEPGSMSDLI